MSGIDTVFRARPASGFGHWVPEPGADLSQIEYVTPQSWVPVSMTFDDSSGPLPDFARVEGHDGVMVIRNDDYGNYGVQFFSSFAAGGHMFKLTGDADGFAIFRPTVWKAVDVASSAGLDQETVESYVFRPDRINPGLFRSVPRIHEIYCGHAENDPDEITDLDDVVNMQFKTWYEIAAITGLDFEPIWHS